ncbi:DUF1275 domain-containing protein [Croceicoccus ponticola]|uniref:DUF1275 domain-containing protein n=2 Tax=Croceicoccus ponticola TaxID=2217664 RepID=A0A437H2C4_9SPHN|nr:DUF1275 domain-containing protein [Croceicoccus ponticola]
MPHRMHHVGILAVLLAGLAGYVDAVGFIASGGYFVSFMSGNSTRLGVGLGSGTEAAAIAAMLIAAFLAGTVAATLLRRKVPVRARESAVLAYVTVLLATAAMVSSGHAMFALIPIAAAMGGMNLAFEVDGDVRVGLTYMTGTLVKLGMRIADAMIGGPPLGWMPYLLLWAGLVTGGVTGAFAQLAFGVLSLWLAAAFALAVTVAVTMSRWRKA